ncbi:MAG: phospho-N-acetylmuramoyl-pentapeptide-transferase [Clostridiales bacterium]|nr:phospho-N-acetylmuramoyl-pentapeptide-transferase [Clostridiales bacterium]
MIILSAVVVLAITPVMIPILHKFKFGQTVRDDGPKEHLKKMGTPTMGGIVFIVSMVILSCIEARLDARILVLVFVTLGFGAVGFVDDFIKIKEKRKDGLYPRQKMFGLIFVATVFAVCIRKIGIDTGVVVPFLKGVVIDLKYLYVPFVVLVLISTTNAVNLTDGLDGLATGVSTIVMLFFMIVATRVSDYTYIKIFCAIMSGGLMGFLVFNKNPAKVFMGDTGSLALGGAIAGVALLMKNPLLLIIVCGVCVIETLSVIIQVTSFKLRGKRVFKMAPLHHHFELSGMRETTVVKMFWLLSVLLCVVGYFSIT